MADRASASAALRKQWNQRAPGGGHTPAARRSRLGLYTVLLFGLVGLLVWWLMQPQQRVYVALLADKYGPDLAVTEKKQVELSIPPTIDPAGVFEANVAPLEKVIGEKQLVLRNLSRQGAAKQIAGELSKYLAEAVGRAWELDKVELLVLYVHAYGLSVDGAPYLLWNEDLAAELRRSRGKPSLFPLADLLTAASGLGAQRTLLVLDCGELAHQPRLGMFVNEFPRLLEKEMADSRYSDKLWVMCGHSPLEIGHVWRDNRQSVFGHFVVEALSKPGEGETDLTAAVFFRRVHDRVEQAALRGAGASQHPMFLIGGKGRVKAEEVPSQVILRSLFFLPNETAKTDESSKARAEASAGGPLLAAIMPSLAQAEKVSGPKPADAAPAEGDKKEEAKKSAGKAPAETTDQKDKKIGPPDTSTVASPNAAAKAPAESKPAQPMPPQRDPFDEIWDLCRGLEDPDNRGVRWSPVDYAPHLWSRFRRQLVWYQLRAAIEGGLEKNAANRQYIERSIRDPLRALTVAGESVNVPLPSAIPILGRVAEARREFFADAARREPGGYATAATPDERVANFARARRVANAIQFAAGECVRLYGFNLHSNEPARYALLVRAIAEAANLRKELESWEGKPLDDRRLDWTETRDRCDEHLQAYLSLRSDLQDELRDLVDARLRFGTVVREPAETFQRRPTPQIEDVGLAHWVDLTLRLAGAGWPQRPGDVSGTFLLDLPATRGGAGIEKHLATVAKVSSGLRADADLWLAYREVGSALRESSIALPRLIAETSATTGDIAAERLTEMRLRLVDPIDAEDESLSATRNPLLARTWLPQPGPKLEIAAPTSIDLRPGEQREVSLSYTWTGDAGAEATIELKHTDAEAGAAVISIVPGTSTIQLSKSGTLSGFAVKAPPETPTGPRARTSTEVVYTVKVGPRSFDSKPVGVRLIGEDFVDLVISQAIDENKPAQDLPLRADERDVGSGPRPLGDRSTLVYHRLSPYPRGTAKYRFSLQSGGGKAPQRHVAVEVFRVVGATDRDKKKEFEPAGELKQGVAERIDALSRRMTLTSGETQPYSFDIDPAKKAAEKEAETAAEKAPEKAEEKPAEKPKADVNNGGGQNDPPAGGANDASSKGEAKPPADAKPIPIDFGDGLIFRVEEATPVDGGGPRVWYHWVEFQPLHPRQYVTSTATYDAARRKLEIVVRPTNNLPYPLDGFLVEWEAGETNADITGWRGSPADRGTRQREVVRLDVQNFVPKTNSETLDVFVAVDGYPRAFYHPVMVAAGPVPTPSTATFRRVRVVSPAHNQVFKGDADATDATPILVEARFDDIPEERDRIQVTFDDGQPTTKTLASSRARHAYFTPGKNGAATFQIRVGDYVRDSKAKTAGDAIPFATRSRDEIIRITAEIAGVSESYRDTPPTRLLLVDYRDPTVTPTPPRPSQVVQKKPHTIELAAIAADEGGVDRVEYFLVGQDKSRLDEEDLAKKNLMAIWRNERPRLGESAPRPRPFATEKLEIGTYWVWAIAYDRVGRKSLETRLGSFRVNEPAPEGEKKIAGVTVRGQAIYNNSSRDGITITLSTPDGANVDSTQPVGEADPAAAAPLPGQRPPRPQFWFTFKDVPPGKYVLTARGTEKTPDGRGVPQKLIQLDPVPFEVKASDKGTLTLDKPIKLTRDR